jgi:hypothetical protein
VAAHLLLHRHQAQGGVHHVKAEEKHI